MEGKSLLYIIQWLLPIWLAGWVLLPVSSRIFPHLPDIGLAAGRLLALIIVCLLAFWGAASHLVPLSFSPLLLIGIFVLASVFACRQHLCKQPIIQEFQQSRRALFFSDAIFLLSFLFFLWLRLCQPEIRGQEKPMDSAIIGVLSRSVYLPAENPWFSGLPFTSYYYFGHLMAATLTRTFQTPLPYAYNLAQPVFCAFFISILWSLCAALTGSRWKGLAVTCLVSFCGNYEPLRQWYLAVQNASPVWPLNWWSTSRVIPHTINEYPFFTLALGDAHAHFFGLSLFALFLCTCLTNEFGTRNSRVALLLQAIIASAVIMTNAWDFPIIAFMALFLICRQSHRIGFLKVAYATLAWIAIVGLLSMPFLRDFHSPTRGLQWEPRLPDMSFLLIWGHFVLLALLLLSILKIKRDADINDARQQQPILFIVFAGIVTLVFPYLLFIQGHFDGALRHQDTVFKFGLQSWLLLGIALGTIITRNTPQSRWPRLLFSCAFAVILLPTIAAPLAVILGRSIRVPGQALTLNGARHLPQAEQSALAWLTANARPGDTVIESVGRNADGTWIGAYSDYSRVSSLTGIPASIGWPQHAIFWGANPASVEARLKEMNEMYLARSHRYALLGQGALPTQSPLPLHGGGRARGITGAGTLDHTCYIFWGALENATYGPPAIAEPHFSNGEIMIFKVH